MDFEAGKAVIAGLIATGVMTMLMYAGSMMGMRMDMPAMLGTMILPIGPAARAVGLMMHLMMGGLFMLVYAGLFAAIDTNAVAGWGALFGVAHGVMAGAAMGLMPLMHPRMTPSAIGAGAGQPGVLTSPGFFGTKVSPMAPVAIIALHAVFGVVGGAVYGA